MSFERERVFLLGLIVGLGCWMLSDYFRGTPPPPMRAALLAFAGLLLIVFFFL